MDGTTWDRALLGPAVRNGGPALRRQRMDARAYVGRRLHEWREDQGLTQAQTHERLSPSGPPSRMHALEAGELPWTDHSRLKRLDVTPLPTVGS